MERVALVITRVMQTHGRKRQTLEEKRVRTRKGR